MKTMSLLASLPLLLGLSLSAHWLTARTLKALAWALSPVALSEPEAFRYERDVYRTAVPETMQVVGVVFGAGLLVWWGAMRGPWWVLAAGLLALVGALVLDLLRWERVAVSASFLWFQRGLRGKVHQVAIENIRDLEVEETDARGLTLRRGLQNRLCRLRVRLNDKHVIALPKTDAYSGLDDVEAVANHLRARLQISTDRMSLHDAEHQANQQAQALAERPPSPEQEMQRELKRLRRNALAPDVPKAVHLKSDR
jgi:hypothetical protein